MRQAAFLVVLAAVLAVCTHGLVLGEGVARRAQHLENDPHSDPGMNARRHLRGSASAVSKAATSTNPEDEERAITQSLDKFKALFKKSPDLTKLKGQLGTKAELARIENIARQDPVLKAALSDPTKAKRLQKKLLAKTEDPRVPSVMEAV
ncbi:Avr1b-1 avirulence-like protein [Phytophthora sojae]|uniref:Avr1b-1 avirulence-like protein n=2 Tax=Phytophthora sojae TaxID=67593 RepID=G5A8G8_PHYSP|nr:Avr1b-1 avirulence-like protein [Phytophthora sojae]AEK80702.1 Avh122 [Phytophthora sojae]AEK80703.1 Avh122 [Phytophthora sojae]AEK80704.1 Avh122 [Phytophthora sojae]EGZ08194.1 Avr1b-1 avirulence-like protein [Phytophthora sojae]|eukprot:XP_009536366.1 Avr1b-1 avirulence-like protein [Phytophthora sojae]